MNNKVLVVGGINMDIVVRTKRLPQSGETVKGAELKYIPGGKGANQAIAASRLGAEVSIIGKVGNDNVGHNLIKFLRSEKLNTSSITQVQNSSGVALIIVEEKGENSIVVVPASNADVTKSYVESYEDVIKQSDIIVAQYEVPIESVKTAFTLAKKYNKITILNPAPALETPDSLLKLVDYLILNETELSFFVDKQIDLTEKEEIIRAAQKLLSRGSKTVIVTVGSKGAITITKNEIIETKGIEVKVIDTTAAGDCFVGALAARLKGDSSLEEALDFANKAAALSVQKFGASTSIPFLKGLKN